MQGYKPVSAQTLNQAAALGKQQAGNDTSINNLMKPGQSVCRGFASANGGQQIDDWIAEGRAAVTKSSITNGGNLCNDFDAALGKQFAQEVDTKVAFAFADAENKGLCKDEGNSAYKCSTPDAEHACDNFAETSYWLKGQHVQCDRGYCIPGVDCGGGPATAKQIYFVCDGVCKLYFIGTQPAKCKIPDQLPVPGMPGSKPSSGVSCPANPTGPSQNPAVNNQQK